MDVTGLPVTLTPAGEWLVAFAEAHPLSQYVITGSVFAAAATYAWKEWTARRDLRVAHISLPEKRKLYARILTTLDHERQAWEAHRKIVKATREAWKELRSFPEPPGEDASNLAEGKVDWRYLEEQAAWKAAPRILARLALDAIEDATCPGIPPLSPEARRSIESEGRRAPDILEERGTEIAKQADAFAAQFEEALNEASLVVKEGEIIAALEALHGCVSASVLRAPAREDEGLPSAETVLKLELGEGIRLARAALVEDYRSEFGLLRRRRPHLEALREFLDARLSPQVDADIRRFLGEARSEREAASG